MPSLVIAGGGYAGLAVARRLAARLDRSWTISLVEQRDCHELLTRLPELVAGTIEKERVCIPLTAILPERVKRIQARVTELDPMTGTVGLDGGPLRADLLVIALGSASSFHDVAGAADHSLTVRSVEEAMRLRQAIHKALIECGEARVVIVGAGYTATEVAGWLTDAAARRPRGTIEVTLVAEDTRLLPQGNERLAAEAARALAAKGVQCRLATSVTRVGPSSITLGDGSTVPTDLTVWAASAAGGWPGPGHGLRFGADRRIEVDEFLRASRYDRVYVVGDCAAARDFRSGESVASSAQLALQEADVAANNVLAQIEGRRLAPFRPITLGEALDLGGADGVAEVLGVVVRGRAALRVKQAALLRYLFSLGGTQLLRAYR